MSHREGVHACDPRGKPSLSLFRSLGYDAASDSSLVLCRAYTGRTHQLRLHLQLLRNPIANDPCYGGQLFYGEDARRLRAERELLRMRRAGVTPLSNARYVLSDEEVARRLAAGEDQQGDGEAEGDDVRRPVAPAATTTPAAAVELGEAEEGEAESLEPREDESAEAFLLRTCRYCVYIHSSSIIVSHACVDYD